MKIRDILDQHEEGISLEFFPPKTEEATDRLMDTIKSTGVLDPRFVSVTYGAGGGTRDNTRQVVERILLETSLIPMPHLTCVGQSKEELVDILRTYRAMGIENVLALRGDMPKDTGKFSADAGLCHAIDLVLLSADLNAFSIGVAVYPEGHVEAPSLERDLLYTKAKIDAGADFAITQMFFDNHLFYDYMDKAERVGITIPIIPGIMPITDLGKIMRFCQTCGTTVPKSLVRQMESAASPEEAERIGIDFTTRQCVDLRQNGVRFFHFYTLNRSDIVTKVLHNLAIERLLGGSAEEELPPVLTY